MDKYLEKQMKIKRNPIASAIKTALYSGLVASVALGGVAFAQDEDEGADKEKLDKQVVTGSRIKRSDVAQALPVTTITREEIELSGESSAADFIRSLTFNSAGSFRPQSGSSAQGVSAVSLRGLGSSRTLVLIDGRRLPASPSTGSNQDLNTIPAGAIERIEVLSDGASAIYGSDAIGGVINVILRTDFQGVEMMIGGAEASIPAHGGDREEGSIVFGASGDRSRLLAGVSWNSREIVFARDYPWYSPGLSTYGNNMESWFVTGNTVNPDTGAYEYDILLQSLPGACNFPGTAFTPVTTSQGLPFCGFNFASVSADDASTDNQSFYAKGSYDVNDDWQVWMNVSVAETESFGRYAPVPDYAYVSASSPNNPTNPSSPYYNPNLTNLYGQPVVNQPIAVYHRYDALGNRDSTVTNRLTRFQLGTTGNIGNAEVEFGVTRSNNRTFDIGNNYLLRSAARAAIESGAYDLWNPYGNSPTTLNSMKVVISRISKYDLDEMFGSVAFDMFEMENGPVSVYVGAETQKIKYSDQYDSLSEAGQIGGSAGNSAAGNRDVDSIYFEALVPFLPNLEMSLAGRYDDYSDFGSEFSPKVSFRYQPLDNLTLRASYGEGFRAPTLDILTQKDSFSADTIQDDPTCLALGQAAGCRVQVDATVTANPNLSAETSKQYSLGLAYEPVDWMNMTLDYYNIEIDNRIRSFTSAYLIYLGNEGLELPPGLSVNRNSTTGRITGIVRGFGNQGVVETSGLDLNVRFNYEFLGGQVSNNFQISHVLDSSVDGGRDTAGEAGLPSHRAILNNTYSYGDWNVAWNINYIDSQSADSTYDAAPSWTTHDLQFNYNAPWDGKFTVGARNLFEKYPPIGLGAIGDRDYDYYLYDGFGRVTYFRYTQTF